MKTDTEPTVLDAMRQATAGLPGGDVLCEAWGRAFPQKSPLEVESERLRRASVDMVEEYLRRAGADPDLHDDEVITFVVEHEVVSREATFEMLVRVRPREPGDREAFQVRLGDIRRAAGRASAG